MWIVIQVLVSYGREYNCDFFGPFPDENSAKLFANNKADEESKKDWILGENYFTYQYAEMKKN
jgi:hypothetical protein